tara:strand:- start:782 stop:1291 length:510 start_codon:yes stop_codon:yes gene_type:complete
MKRNSRHKAKKKEITLMTILANEATKESQAILSKYKKPKAQSYSDLEMKLAELYFAPKTDKIILEKELASIHPHKTWLIKTLELDKPTEKVEVIEEIKPSKLSKETCTSDSCIDEDCTTHGNQGMSGFSGEQTPNSKSVLSRSNIEIIGLVSVVGLIGLTFIIVSKNLK